MALARAFAAAAAAASILSAPAYAYVYHAALAVQIANFTWASKYPGALRLSEGPMYPSGELGGESTIAVEFAASVTAGASAPPPTWGLTLYTVFVGPNVDVTKVVACCTPALYLSGACSRVGAFELPPGMTDAVAHNVTLPVGQVTNGSATYVVRESGYQYAYVVVCPSPLDSSSARALQAVDDTQHVDVTVTFAFRNPYGYLPGMQYGLLPFYGALFVAYLVFVLAFGAQLVRHRAYALPLQVAIACVGLAGVVETAAWFFMLNSKNATGVPTPCVDLCATTPDFLAAVMLSVLKRAASRGGLLAVALGYGVVHPVLDRRGTATCVGLSLAYLVFGVLDAVSRRTSYDLDTTTWELPVVLVDLAFIFVMYSGLLALQRDLGATGQQAKLLMYSRLLRVLYANVAAWIAVTLLSAAVQFDAAPFPWRLAFLLSCFWDALYLSILCAVAWIWAPGPESFRYAYYAQSAGDEGGAGSGDAAEAGHGGGGGGDHDGIPAPGDFAIEEEDDVVGSSAPPPRATTAPPTTAAPAPGGK